MIIVKIMIQNKDSMTTLYIAQGWAINKFGNTVSKSKDFTSAKLMAKQYDNVESIQRDLARLNVSLDNVILEKVRIERKVA